MIRAEARDVAVASLARAAIAGELGDWYLPQLRGCTAWIDASAQVAQEFKGRDWLGVLAPALGAGGAAAERIAECAASNGIVVTTGQQPGLFGGPLYVLHKALTALALADAIRECTGVATAPVFWAATDDTDYTEANTVSVVVRGRVETLTGGSNPAPGLAMAATPLGDVSDQLRVLADACGSAADAEAVAAVRRAYHGAATVGSAYVAFLRELLEPLGVTVLDAAHSAVREAGADVLLRALSRADAVRGALQQRTADIRARKYRAQVADVPAVSLVFAADDTGARQRVPVRDAAATAGRVAPARLGPNVLLRPVMERSILPTVAYVGGPGEVGYFAQVSAVAEALQLPLPRIVPRWGGTLIEPHVQDILGKLSATVDDFRDPHAMEGRIAREELPAEVRDSLQALRDTVASQGDRLAAAAGSSLALRRSAMSMRAGVEHRLARLERRYAATVKRTGNQRLRDVTSARASLFPHGGPQERVLSFVPFVARYGPATVDVVLGAARDYVLQRLIAR